MAHAENSGLRGDASEPSSSPAPGWGQFFTPQGLERLAAVQLDLDRGESAMSVGNQLRKQGLPGDDVAAILSQADLRRKARVKFGEAANRLLFTPAGLEQASRAPVAALHAQRFARAQIGSIADLGCGLATESIAFMQVGLDVLAVEIDPFTASIAQHNLATMKTGSASFQVMTASAEDVSLEQSDAAFFDPARRTSGHRDTKRLSNPDDYSPSLDFAFAVARSKPTGMKLGPGFDRDLIPSAAEAQWVSVDGHVVETGLWFGAVAREGIRRSALLLKNGETHELAASEDAEDAEVSKLSEYLYEPDGAVIRARLIGMLAEQIGASMLSEGIAYLTSSALAPTPFAQSFRVLDELPASEKQLARALAARGIGTLEIKKRGIDVDPAGLRKRLRLKGRESATLILTRVAGKHTALLAERC